MHPVDLDIQYCLDAYSNVFSSSSDIYVRSLSTVILINLILSQKFQDNVDDTNEYYQTKQTYPNNGVSNVVYVHGTVDPWHTAGIFEGEMSEEAPYILIQGSSHCADMYDPARITSPELEEARAQIREYVRTWLGEWPGQ